MQHATHLEPIDFLGAILVALIGSAHCVGMCGGLAAAASVPGAGLRHELPVVRARTFLASQAIYHLGKTTSYLFLGILAAVFGLFIVQSGSWATRSLSVLAGGTLVLLGRNLLGAGAKPHSAIPALRAPARAFARTGSALLALRSPVRPLLLGAFSGLLPCPLVYAFLGKVAAHASVPGALVTMLGLGLGTLPLLTIVSGVTPLLDARKRQRWRTLAGVALIAFGLWTVYRGWVVPSCCVGPA